MDGKNVVVTGASSGVGLVTARVLAERGANVIMICRDAARGAAARDEVTAAARGPAPTLLLADLSSIGDVRKLAAEVRSRLDRIDVLINNAAGVFQHRELTVDGIERTFATNHLAPFLLTTLLLDRVQAAPAGRIVNVASETHSGSIDFDDLQSERGHHFFKSYALSKLCNLLFTYELARRLAGSSVTANGVSPGPTLSSFGRGEGGLLRVMRVLMRVLAFLRIASTPERGARTILFVATAPELATVTGRFFLRGRERKTKPITHDAAVAARLWKVSEALCARTPSRAFEVNRSAIASAS